MPTKCNKVKNPCKICLESVGPKNGLQCQGACKKWVHFTCLNYTPGKIKDIRQGLIKVTCPCPDCKTTEPKEYRTDEPFSCTNIQCPSNLPRTCISNSCPSNQNADGAKRPLQLCEQSTCKLNKAPAGMTAYGNEMGNSAGVSCPSSSSGYAMRPQESSLVKGDMGQSSLHTGHAMNVVGQICNTVEQLSAQINSLMKEMKNLMDTRQGNTGGCNMGNGADKTKPCNCPGNPRR